MGESQLSEEFITCYKSRVSKINTDELIFIGYISY